MEEERFAKRTDMMSLYVISHVIFTKRESVLVLSRARFQSNAATDPEQELFYTQTARRDFSFLLVVSLHFLIDVYFHQTVESVAGQTRNSSSWSTAGSRSLCAGEHRAM